MRKFFDYSKWNRAVAIFSLIVTILLLIWINGCEAARNKEASAEAMPAPEAAAEYEVPEADAMSAILPAGEDHQRSWGRTLGEAGEDHQRSWGRTLGEAGEEHQRSRGRTLGEAGPGMNGGPAAGPDLSPVSADTPAWPREAAGTAGSGPRASATPTPATPAPTDSSGKDALLAIIAQIAATPAPADKTPARGSRSGAATATPVPAEASSGSGLPYVEITEDTVIDTGAERVYNFRSEAWAGCGLDGTVMPFELYYGLHGTVRDGALTYRAYSHLEDVEPTGHIRIYRNSSGNSRPLPDVSTDEEVSVDLSNQVNDSFGIVAEFSNDTLCYLTVYINDGQAYLVDDTQASVQRVTGQYLTKPDTIRQLAESHGVTPERSLGVDMWTISYPAANRPEYNRRCDTDLWRALAHEIVPDDTLADSVKVVMLHDWMTANLAYDYYKVNTLKLSRAGYHKDWSGKWSVYETHTGVCLDFVNIFAIMCREFGIPCSSLDSTELNHTWSIVCLDGKWYEIDLTRDIRRAVYREDVTDVRNASRIVNYKTFLTPAPIKNFNLVDAVGEDILCESYRLTGEHQNCPHTS